MPTVREVEAYLYSLAPKETAMEWDNVGLLAGDPEGEVRNILVSLDITEDVVREAIEGGYQLIAAHHPVMNCRWRPVQSLRADDFQGRLLRALVRHDIAAVCMHTNLDRAAGGVNDCLAAALGLSNEADVPDKAAGFSDEAGLPDKAGLSKKTDRPGDLPGGDGFCKMGTLPEPVPLERFAGTVAAALGCAGLRYADAGRPVHRVAVGGGACSEYAEPAVRAGCDTFVTGDVKYHAFLDARAMGLNLIDAGHFPTENPVCGMLARWLGEAFPPVRVDISARHGDVVRFYHRDGVGAPLML